MEPADLDSALKELSKERELLDALRVDYARVAQSRFFHIREIWRSLKRLIGGGVWAPPVVARPRVSAPAGTHELLAKPENARLVATWNARAATRPLSDKPLVSIVIPAHNHADTTTACLQSIADGWFETLAVQIIVVDDASTDGTAGIVGLLEGVDLVSNGRNQGFVRSCNRGASIAGGKYICFLNNDTIVSDAWLDELVTLAESDDYVGAVGSKLIYPDGTLQEAGGIIFNDGTGWNYGRTENAADPRYTFVREVDYCSGAALLVRTSAFRELGGFDDAYAPAYYEDVDLCFGLRSLGYRVLYQPRSVVTHLEGISSGTDVRKGTKRFQEINRTTFVEKWKGELARYFPGDARHVPDAARRRRGAAILVIDSYVPVYDKEAGSNRLFKILKILVDAGYYVFFLPDNYAALQPYTRELQDLGVEVLHHVAGGRSASDALHEILPLLDIAWICRPELFEKYHEVVSRNEAAKTIYDTIDLHFVRKKREAELLGDTDSAEWQEVERLELRAARSADLTITVSEPDRAALRERGISDVAIIPTIHTARVGEKRRFEDRSGLLFIGGYGHTPNVDAVAWLCRDIMPMVWDRVPDAKVTLLGNNPPQAVKDLASSRVIVPGYLRDVSAYFEQSRVFVAPLRFGAGLKGKIGQSLEFALPVVTTPVGAEGFPLRSGENCYIAASADDFAQAVIKLYTDEPTWSSFARASAEVLEEFSDEHVGRRIRSMLGALTAAVAVR